MDGTTEKGTDQVGNGICWVKKGDLEKSTEEQTCLKKCSKETFPNCKQKKEMVECQEKCGCKRIETCVNDAAKTKWQELKQEEREKEQKAEDESCKDNEKYTIYSQCHAAPFATLYGLMFALLAMW